MRPGASADSLIAYGDNYGTFHTHRFDAGGFGKAAKVAAKERNATRVEFVNTGQMLAIGGMGYLATYLNQNGKFVPAHEVSIVVRDFLWLNNGELILVNQGLNGISAYRHDSSGFHPLGSVAPGEPVAQMAVSSCRKYLAATFQQSSEICVYTTAD